MVCNRKGEYIVSGIIVRVCIVTFQNRKTSSLTSWLVCLLKLDNIVVIHVHVESTKPSVRDNVVILD